MRATERQARIESCDRAACLAVHAYGPARLITAPAEAKAVRQRLIERHEPPYAARWAILPERHRTGMLNGLVALEITVQRREGKFKLSQDRAPGEQRNMITAPESLGDPDSLAMAGRMCWNLPAAEAAS